MRKRKAFWIPVAIVGAALFVFLGGEIVKELWNWLLPPLFGWHEVTFWQALGLLALCRILFGGFGRHGGPGSKMRREMKEGMEQRMAAMTPEEREQFRQKMRRRCGWGPEPGGPSPEAAAH